MSANNALFADIETALPDWLPPVWRERLSGTREVVKFSGVELEALHRVPRRKMSEWAEEGGYVALGANGSDWSSDVTPHAAKVMDTWWHPSTREVVTCFVEQDGKTAILYNCLGGAQDMDPSTDMVVMPGEKKSGDVAAERIIPMFRNSKRLKRIVSPRADDTTKMLIRLTNGGRVFMSWASSADALSSWPIKRIYYDETDKYPPLVGKEASSFTLGDKRVRTFEDDYKIYKSSTPTNESGYIYKELLSCPQIWVWHLRCTHCGDTFRAGAEHLDIPPGATVETINAGEHEVHLACPGCGSTMTNSERKLATRTGLWVCIKGADLVDPEKVGFHRRAYDCKDVSLKQIAVAKLKADTGDYEAKIAWANGYEAINFEDVKTARKEDSILALRDDRREGELPAQPFSCITAVADMQKRGFWYKITAWGYGIEQESWLLKASFVDSWEALRKLFYESEFVDASGQKHLITLRGIDSGGGEGDGDLSKTAEAYLFAYRNPGMHLFKGQQHMTSLFRGVPQDKIPGTNKALPGGLTRHNLHTTELKNRLSAKLQVSPGDPGAMHLHRDVDQDFARQMCAEVIDEKGHYQNPQNKPNHYWDCSYMELALVEINQVKLWPRPDAQAAPPQRRVYSKGVRRD